LQLYCMTYTGATTFYDNRCVKVSLTHPNEHRNSMTFGNSAIVAPTCQEAFPDTAQVKQFDSSHNWLVAIQNKRVHLPIGAFSVVTSPSQPCQEFCPIHFPKLDQRDGLRLAPSAHLSRLAQETRRAELVDPQQEKDNRIPTIINCSSSQLPSVISTTDRSFYSAISSQRGSNDSAWGQEIHVPQGTAWGHFVDFDNY
jgi:hypothetical protein